MALLDQSIFLKRAALPMVFDDAELDIPSDPPSPPACQKSTLGQGSIFSILNARFDRVGYYRVESYDNFGAGAKYSTRNVTGGKHLFLSNWQIAELERQGRLFPQEAPLKGKDVDTLIALKPEQITEAQRKIAYVEAIIDADDDFFEMPESRKIVYAADKLAKERGERRPCLATLREAITKYLAHPFNRELALAPRVSSGNKVRHFTPRVEDLMRVSAEWAWSRKKGTAARAVEFFDSLIHLPDNAIALEECKDENGDIVLPSTRTIERRMRAVPHFMRDLLRYGQEYAMRVHSVKIPQILPTAPLQVVECDFVRLDVVGMDERLNIMYGRAWGCFFKDRYSGGVLGYSLFFGSPDFESFVDALKMAVFPKDMRGYPGLTYPIHGFMLHLVVDADQVLVSDNMVQLCKHFGILLRELRAGEPNSKGSIERFFRTQNEALFHDLPGSTHSNPARRKQHEEREDADLPKLTLKELDQLVMAFVCRYNTTLHKGLGVLRNWEGIPEQRFLEGIGRAHHRPPMSVDAFAAFSGDVEYLAIRGGTIVWDYITYFDARLAVLATDGEATPPPDSGDGRKPRTVVTKYKCVRDPSDLGYIHVHIPELGTAIKVFADGQCRNYARGLRLYQHRKAKEYYKKRTGRALSDFKDLEPCLKLVTDEMRDAQAHRKTNRTAQRVAAFYRSQTSRIMRSQVVDAVYDEEESRWEIDPGVDSRSRKKPRKSNSEVAALPAVSHPRDEDGRLDPVAAAAEQHEAPKSKKSKKAVHKPNGFVDLVDDPDAGLSYEEILARYNDEVKG